jgi:ceramide glucosyltransferase
MTGLFGSRLIFFSAHQALADPVSVSPMIPGASCALSLVLFDVRPGKILAAGLLLVLCGALVYSLLSIIAAMRYLAVRPCTLQAAEAISILKPLAGLDLNLESNLRTFFEQGYPAFEILFAVKAADDPAADVVARLQREYPKIPSRLLITGEPPYPNAKVYSLERMLAAAANDLVVMSDSDIRVTPDMLRTIAAEFQDLKLGVATCPYRAVPGASFWSRLEATGMNTDFWGSALVARMLEGMRFAVGPTIAARRRVLHSIGGFERVKDYLAEDFVIGKFAAEAGHGVILSSYVIEHHIGSATLQQNIAHRLRWGRSTRRSRPAGYVGQLFTMPLPVALLVCAASPAWWPVLPLAVGVRALAAYTVSVCVLRAKINWLLLPIEDLMGFCFWIAGFFGNTICWRGRHYRLFSDGRFELIPPTNP